MNLRRGLAVLFVGIVLVLLFVPKLPPALWLGLLAGAMILAGLVA